MPDGHWTQWHIAELAIREAQQQVLREMEQEFTAWLRVAESEGDDSTSTIQVALNSIRSKQMKLREETR